MTSKVSTRLSTDACAFIPGAGSHCPVNARTYRHYALQTLNTPGGVPSHTFHIKFSADHGLPWKSRWAGIDGLKDLEKEGVGRWTEGGQLIYGTDEQVARRIYSSQKPPAPLCIMGSQGIQLIPCLAYSFDGYEIRKSMKRKLEDTKIIGLNVRLEQVNNTNNNNKKIDESDRVIKLKLKSTPWQITSDVKPWCTYKVGVQLVTRDFGTSIYSEQSETSPADLNVLFKHVDLENELLWAKHYKEYAARIELKKVESLLKRYTDEKHDYETLTKQVKADEKVKDGGFRPRDTKVIRISGEIRSKLPPVILNKPRLTEKDKNQEYSPDQIKCIHLRVADTNGNMKIVVVGGFSGEILHVSGKFRMKKPKQSN